MQIMKSSLRVKAKESGLIYPFILTLACTSHLPGSSTTSADSAIGGAEVLISSCHPLCTWGLAAQALMLV